MVGPMRQETVVAIAPEPAVEVLEPLRRRRAHQRPPAARQRLLQQLRQRLVEAGPLQVVEPDVAGAVGHALSGLKGAGLGGRSVKRTATLSGSLTMAR